jgi:hypothetical protein
MVDRDELEKLAGRISVIRHELEELRTEGQGFTCIDRNVGRMLACVKMLELDISDAVEHIQKP